MNEQEFFEKQVREYYNQLMNKLGLKHEKQKNFSELNKSLCSYVWKYSRENSVSFYHIDAFKHRINNIFDDKFVFPLYYDDSFTGKEGIRFIQPNIINNSEDKLKKYFESLNDFVSIEEKENEDTLKFQIYLETPRLSTDKKFNGDILYAVIRNIHLTESKFNLILSIDAENISKVLNKPSVPVFYNVETILETNPIHDWVKTIGEKYLVEDKSYEMYGDENHVFGEGPSIYYTKSDEKKLEKYNENKSFFDC